MKMGFRKIKSTDSNIEKRVKQKRRVILYPIEFKARLVKYPFLPGFFTALRILTAFQLNHQDQGFRLLIFQLNY